MPDPTPPASPPPTPAPFAQLTLAQQLTRLGLHRVPSPSVFPAGPVSLPKPYEAPVLSRALQGLAARVVSQYEQAAQVRKGAFPWLATNEPVIGIPPIFGVQFPVRTRLAEMAPMQASRYVRGVLESIRFAAGLDALIRQRPLAIVDIETLGAQGGILTELALSVYAHAPLDQLAGATITPSKAFRQVVQRMRAGQPEQVYAWLVRPTAAQQAYLERLLAKAAAGHALTSRERSTLAQLARYAGATLHARSPSLMQVQLQQEAQTRSQALLRSAFRITAQDIQQARAGLAFLLQYGVSREEIIKPLTELLQRQPILAGLNIRLFDIPRLRAAFARTQVADLLAQAQLLDIQELADLVGPEAIHAQLMLASGRVKPSKARQLLARVESARDLLAKAWSRFGFERVHPTRVMAQLAKLPGTPLSQESLLYTLDPTARVAHTAAADVRTTARIAGALLPQLMGAARAATLPGVPAKARPGLRQGLWVDPTQRVIYLGKYPLRRKAPLFYSPPPVEGWGVPVFVPRAVVAQPPSFVLEESTGEAMYHPPGQPVTLLSREYVYRMGVPSVVREKSGAPEAIALAFRSPELRRVAFMVEPVDPRILKTQGEAKAIEEATLRLQARVLASGILPAGTGDWAALLEENLIDRARRAYQRLFEIDRSRTSGVRLLEQLALAQQLMDRAGADVDKAWALLSEQVRARRITHAVAIDAMTLLGPQLAANRAGRMTRLRAELPYLLRFVQTYASQFPSEAQLVLAMRRFHRLLSSALFAAPEQVMRPLRPGEMQVLLHFGERPYWIPMQSPQQFLDRLTRAMESQIAPGASAAERAATQAFLLQQAIESLQAQPPIRVGDRLYRPFTRLERAMLTQALRSAGTDLEAAFRNQAMMLYRILARRLEQPGPIVTVGNVNAPVYLHFFAQGGQVPMMNIWADAVQAISEEQLISLMEQATGFARRLSMPPEDPLLRYAIQVAQKAQEGRISRTLQQLHPGMGVSQAPPIGMLPWWVETPGGRRHFLTLYAPSEAGAILAAIEQGTIPAPSALSATIEIPTIETVAEVPIGGKIRLPVRAVRYGGQERVVPLAFLTAQGQIRTAEERLQAEIVRHLPPLIRQVARAAAGFKGVDPNRMVARIHRAFREQVERLAGLDSELLTPEERAKVRVTTGTYAAARRGLVVDFRELLEARVQDVMGGPLQARITAARSLVTEIPEIFLRSRRPQWMRIGRLLRQFGIFGLKDDELVEGKLALFDPRALMPFGAHYSPTHPNVLQFLAHYRFEPEELRKVPGALPYTVFATHPYRAWERRLGRGQLGTVSLPIAMMSAEDVMRRVEELAKTSSFWRTFLEQGLVPAPYQSAVLLASELVGALPGALPKSWRIPLHLPGVELHPEIQKWIQQALTATGPVPERRFARGELPYLYRLQGQLYTPPDRDIILRQVARDVEGRDLILSGVVLHPIESGAKVLLGPIKGAAYPVLTQERLQELAGLPGIWGIATLKTRDIGGEAAGILGSFFGEAITPYLQSLYEARGAPAARQAIRTLQRIFRKHFTFTVQGKPRPLDLSVVAVPGMGPRPTVPAYYFNIPGLLPHAVTPEQAAAGAPVGELVRLIERASEDPLDRVRAFVAEAARTLGVEIPAGLLPPPTPGAAQRLMLPLVRAQVQEVLKFRSALGGGTGGWELHPQEILSMANWASVYGAPTSSFLDYLESLLAVPEGARGRPQATYRAVRGVLEAMEALYPAAGEAAVPPPSEVLDVAELGPLPAARQRRGGLTAQALEMTIVGPRPGGKFSVRPGDVWYLRIPERLPERPPLQLPGQPPVAPGRFVLPETGQELTYLPVGYIPLGEARRTGTWGTEYHTALKRLQSALTHLQRIQLDAATTPEETYERLARAANERVERALAEYFRVLRSAVVVKPKAGGFVGGLLETFTAPASRYFITAPYLPSRTALERVLQEPSLLERYFGRVLIHPEAAAEMLIGGAAGRQVLTGAEALAAMEKLVAGTATAGQLGLPIDEAQVAILRDIWERARQGRYVAPVGRNPVVAVTSIAPLAVKIATTPEELALVASGRVAAIDPISAALMYADFDQDQIAMLFPYAPKLKWDQVRYQRLQEELSRTRRAYLRYHQAVALRILEDLRSEAEGVGALRLGMAGFPSRSAALTEALRKIREKYVEPLFEPARLMEGVLETRLIKTATTGPLYNELQRLRQYAWALWGPEERLPAEIAQRIGPLRTGLLDLLEGLSHVAQEQLSIKAGKHGGRAIEHTRAIQAIIRGSALQAMREEPERWAQAVDYLASFLAESPDYLWRYRHWLPAMRGIQDIRALTEDLRQRGYRELAAQMLGAAALTRQAAEEALGLGGWMQTAAARRGLTRQEAPTLAEALAAAQLEKQPMVTMGTYMAAARVSPKLRGRVRELLTDIRRSAAEWLSKELPEGLRPGHPLEVLARAASPEQLGTEVLASPATTGQVERSTARAVRASVGKRLQQAGQAMRRGLAGREWIAAASVGAAIGLLGLISYRRSHEPLEVGGVAPAPMLYNPTPRILPEDPRTGGYDVRILARRKQDIPGMRIGSAIGQAIETAARVPVDVRISERRDSDDVDEAELQREIARIIRIGS